MKRFAHIIGFRWDAITFVDCFSGPWKTQSQELEDTSFATALRELRKAQATHKARGKPLHLRCMFLEKDPAPFAKLKEFADKVTDATVETHNKELAGAIKDVLRFIRQGGPASFPFVFIDPTGWKGFEMALIASLLRLRPGEVLINFMTDYIRRFIDHPQQQMREQFAALFGSDDVKDRVQALADPQEREDALVMTYAENVRKTGGFAYTCAAIVLYPEIDRRFFHLIYETRNSTGVEVFKDVEQRAMEVQEHTRAQAKQRRRVKKSGQPELFGGEEMPHSRPIDALRTRYLEQARKRLLALLQARRRVPYEEAWDLALSFPLVWERDVKEWIRDWRVEELLSIDGTQPGQRVPRLDEENVLVWQPPAREGGKGS